MSMHVLSLKHMGKRPPAVRICQKTKDELDFAPELVSDPSHLMAEDYGSITDLQGVSME